MKNNGYLKANTLSKVQTSAIRHDGSPNKKTIDHPTYISYLDAN